MFSSIRRLIADRAGNFGLLFALSSFALIFAVGVAIDFGRAYSVRVSLQANLDAALVAAAKTANNTTDENTIKNGLITWLSAQKAADGSEYDIKPADIQIDISKGTISAVARATLPTTFLSIGNISTLKVATKATIEAPSASYLNVYIVLDKSASMLLAATPQGQTAMRTYAGGCVFGCHTAEGGPYHYNGQTFTTNYALARAMGVSLRADVSVTAAKEVLTMIDAADPTHSRIKVSFYTAGSKLTQVVAPTFSTTTARNALDDDSKKLNGASSEDTSRFDTTLPALSQSVGTVGDGKTAGAPLKLVLLLTDGVISQRDWVLNGVWWDSQGKMQGGTDWSKVSPLNPAWCNNVKTKATMGVLYTEYLSASWDQGYVHTVGETMSSANWKNVWGGIMKLGIPASTTRRDYLPYALAACATSDEMFIAASSPTDIAKGLGSLFKTYLGSVRLTQ